MQVKYPERPNHHAKYDNSLKKAVLKAVEKLYGEFGMAAFTNSYQCKILYTVFFLIQILISV